MSKPKKLRADSKLNALSEEELGTLNALLGGGDITLAEGVEWLAARGVKLSAQALSDYYRLHVLPQRHERMRAVAAALNKVPDEEVTDASHRAVAQRVFELATDPQADPETLCDFYKLLIKAEATEQAGRKLALLEARAAAADAAKAALESKVKSGGLSPEALALAEEQLKLL